MRKKNAPGPRGRECWCSVVAGREEAVARGRGVSSRCQALTSYSGKGTVAANLPLTLQLDPNSQVAPTSDQGATSRQMRYNLLHCSAGCRQADGRAGSD